MSHNPWCRLSWLLAWPALMLTADLAIRARIVGAFTAIEWSCYVASVVLMTGLWWLLARLLLRARARGWTGTYRFILGLLSLGCLSLLGFGYSIYAANGDLPDLFLLSFIRCETENALIMFKDSFSALQASMLVLAAMALAFWIDRWRRWEEHAGPSGKRTLVIVSGLSGVSLWVCWSATVARGQCFVPVVRIPLVVAMYAHNEIKGINPKPIRLPAREPLAIPTRLPQPAVNVLLILNESLRRQNLQIHGYQRNTTPFMTEFAAKHPGNFFQFDQTYANATTTLLSVPSILTGIAPIQPLALRTKAPLLWQWAAAADMQSFYFTSHDLEWLGLGDFITTPPPDQSWDQRNENLPPYRDMGSDDHITVDRAIQHITALAASDRPFLGVVHLNSNHYPYNTETQYQRWTGSDLDLYDNTILETDTHTRHLIDALQSSGQLDHTVIIFASDHGEAFKEHGYIAHFYCHFTETISVPLWIWLPEKFAASRDLTSLRDNRSVNTQNLDILPTILDCIGAWENPELQSFRAPMMGRSLFRPIDPQRTAWITNTDEIMPSVIGLSSVTGRFHYMLRTSGSPPLEDLYDIMKDPAENNNLWPTLPEADRDAYRRGFLQFPVSAAMMKTAFPHLSGAQPTTQPAEGGTN